MIISFKNFVLSCMGNKSCCSNTYRTRNPHSNLIDLTNTSQYVPHLTLPNKSSEISSSDFQQKYLVELFLPSYYNIEILTDDLHHEQECAICFEPFHQRDIIARLECLCIYHKQCLDQWSRRQQCCPLHMDKALLTINREELISSTQQANVCLSNTSLQL